jgi:hypothetical protein
MDSYAKSLSKIEQVFEAALQQGLPIPVWGWPPLKTYNGFTHEQRVRGWQAEKLAIRLGLLPDPTTLACYKCGARQPTAIGYHAEDYTTLERFAVCKPCHTAIHKGQSHLPVSQL